MPCRRRPLPGSLANHLRHHARFYSALLLGIATYFALRGRLGPVALAAGVDAFFLFFLAMVWHLVFALTPRDLDRRADLEDEGMVIVVLITVAAIAASTVAVFTLLNQRHPVDGVSLGLVVAGAPLGWLALHTLCAFHYAYIFYSGPPSDDPEAMALKFPGLNREPGPWDFIYFAFVIGMTAQVSDVLVQTTRMRRVVTSHGVAAFLFNTVLIAMAVNAAVAGFQPMQG